MTVTTNTTLKITPTVTLVPRIITTVPMTFRTMQTTSMTV